MQKKLNEYKKDIETCFGTSCNLCERNCPVYQIQKKKTFTSRGRNRTILGILEGKITPNKEMADVYYQCSQCGSCERWCALPNMEIARAFREYLVECGLEKSAHKKNLENLRKTGNPYGKDKNAWKKGLDLKGKILFFSGCTTPIKQPELLKKIVKIFGNKICVIENEPCCGSYFLRTGYIKDYERVQNELIDYIQKNKIKEIITACPGCMSTIKKSLEDKGIKIEVRHLSEKLAEMIKKGELKLKKKYGKITYHDACHLSRPYGIFEPPREILRYCGELVEMKHNRYDSLCCGAGAGVKASFPNLADEMAKRRIKEAKDISAELLITECPFCENNLKDKGIEVKDIIDLVEECKK